jgi:glutathione peroxidase
METIYDITVKDNQGKTTSLAEYQGDVLLIVNTAIKCGLAPQYEDLQDLYDQYQEEGFVVLDFPSNQFLQSPESNEETTEHCTQNYGTTFPRFDKVNVNGQEASPLYKHLKEQQGGLFGKAIKWNFTKFLVDREGKVVERYAPTVNPKEIEEDIQNLL